MARMTTGGLFLPATQRRRPELTLTLDSQNILLAQVTEAKLYKHSRGGGRMLLSKRDVTGVDFNIQAKQTAHICLVE